MSRAFVKESAESAPPPERMISDGPNPVTQAGYEKIAAEVARLEGALKSESNVLLRETLERDLRYWAVKKASAEIVRLRSEGATAGQAPPPEGAAIAFGSRITLTRNGKTQTLRIVGEDEADPARGLVSWRSPLAQAVIGAEEGDEIEMEKPKAEIVIVRVEN